MFKAFLISLSFVASIDATVFYPIDTTSVLSCLFSSTFQNRIMFKDGKIEKIIAQDEELLSIFIEELSGQAFISRRSDEITNTALSVVLETGAVQDMLIHFVERAPEIVILEEPEILKESLVEEPQSQQSILMRKIEDILCNQTPEGYRGVPMQRVQQRIKKNVFIESLARFDNREESIYLYQVYNDSSKHGVVSEGELQCKGARWVFLENPSLGPKQRTYAIICVGKDE